jgi:DNA-binding IclR family transcriptional regulator
MDTLKAIQVFVCIAQQGNLSKAAEHLDYSKAMVSRYLEHLNKPFLLVYFSVIQSFSYPCG